MPDRRPGPSDAPVHDPPLAHERGVSGDRLRAVMRHVASPVTVVTTAAGGRHRGATIGSFTSVSLDPPLVSFNVMRGTGFHQALLEADTFAVHLLGEDQAALAEHFAVPDLSDEEQFRGLELAEGRAGRPPVLAGTPAVLLGRIWAVYDAGDHDLVLGEVAEVTEESRRQGPLLYYARSYRAVGPKV